MILALPQSQHYANSSFCITQCYSYTVLYVLNNDVYTAFYVFTVILYVIMRLHSINIRHYEVHVVTYMRNYAVQVVWRIYITVRFYQPSYCTSSCVFSSICAICRFISTFHCIEPGKVCIKLYNVISRVLQAVFQF